MNKKKIKAEYNQKINLLNKFNKFYYIDNNPKVTDQKYDELKKEIILLEKSILFLNRKNLHQISLVLSHQKILKKLCIKCQCFHLQMHLVKMIY